MFIAKRTDVRLFLVILHKNQSVFLGAKMTLFRQIAQKMPFEYRTECSITG